MNGDLTKRNHFEDTIKLTGFRICENSELAIRNNAALIIHKHDDFKTSASLRLICLEEDILFSPPLYINNIYHRQTIRHKDIVGFFLTPTFNTKMILVVHETPQNNVHLYGIQFSSAKKAQKLSQILGDTSDISNNKIASYERIESVNAKTIAVKPQQSEGIFHLTEPKKSVIELRAQPNEIASKPIRTEFHWDRFDSGAESKVRMAKSVEPLNNGYHAPATSDFLRTTPKSPLKIPGIVSSDIENDWDDLRSVSRTHFMDDIDERISIGYYNDETESTEFSKTANTELEEFTNIKESASQNAWMENITYISNDSFGSGNISSNGSVYMYVAQQVHPRYGRKTDI